MKNYAQEVIKQFPGMASQLDQKGFNSKELFEQIKNSEHFVLPRNAKCWPAGVCWPNDLRMPFKKITLSFDVVIDGGGAGKILIVAFEDGDLFLRATLFQLRSGASNWGIAPVMIEIDLKNMTFGAEALDDRDMPDEGPTQDIVTGILAFLSALNHPKTKQVVINKSSSPRKSAKNNGKRYRKVVIDLEAIALDYKGKSAGGGWTVRLHRRRGHKRRLHTGKEIWIKPCMVGNGEKISHEYQIEGSIPRS